MEIRGTAIAPKHAEAFGMWAMRIIVTAVDVRWVDRAVAAMTGYGTSIIGCDAEAGLESRLGQAATPDGRAGAALLFFARKSKDLAGAVMNRIGQCAMTCPTTAVFDGLLESCGVGAPRFEIGERVGRFGDGYQSVVEHAGRRCVRVPVMDGDFFIEESFGQVKAIGGGQFLVCGVNPPAALSGAERAVEAIDLIDGAITPFPGGVCRCGSKVGTRHSGGGASTNQPFCPTLRGAEDGGGEGLAAGVGSVYEVVINGLNRQIVERAIGAGIRAACGEGVIEISACDFDGRLGKTRFDLHNLLRDSAGPDSCSKTSKTQTENQ